MFVTAKPNFPSNSALAEGLRVKLSGGNLAVAAGNEDELGTLEMHTLAGDLSATVLPIDTQGVRHMVASEAITQYATVYAAAGGKIAASGTLIRGVAMEAASGNGSVIKVMTVRASTSGAVSRAQLTQDDLAAYVIDLVSQMRVHDARQTNLPGTAANDDMGLITGTPGTDAPTLQGVDFGGTTTDEKAAFTFVLPPEYVAGESITLRVRAAMLTTVSDGTATVDAEVFKENGDGGVGSDICATAAQSINSLTPANKDFTITPTGLVAGDVLQVRLSFVGSDTGNVGVMIPEISKVSMLLDVKG
jgi:hypothetical protein